MEEPLSFGAGLMVCAICIAIVAGGLIFFVKTVG